MKKKTEKDLWSITAFLFRYFILGDTGKREALLLLDVYFVTLITSILLGPTSKENQSSISNL